MPDQAFADSRGVSIFLSSLPGQARPGWKDQSGREEQEEREIYEYHKIQRTRLETWLMPLSRAGRVTLWHDGMLSGGRKWELEIAEHLQIAQIIVLLLSPAYFQSSFCYEQMQQALARHAKGATVLPVYLLPIVGIEHYPLGELAGLPGEGHSISGAQDPDVAWYEVAQGINTVVRKHNRQDHAISSPTPPVYRNVVLKHPPVPLASTLIPRAALVETLYQRLIALENNTTGLLLTGLSGTGKTTLAALVYAHAEQQRQAKLAPFTRAPLWLDIGPTVTLMDVICSLRAALGLPLPLSFALTANELAEELFILLEQARCLVIFDQFDAWLDPQSGQARPEQVGVGEWLALLNSGSEAFAGRVLLTSNFYPHRLFPYGEASGVHHYAMPRLETVEGIQLLRVDRVPTIEQATDRELAGLVEQYQGHPQMLAWLRQTCKRNASLHVADFLQPLSAYSRWLDDALPPVFASLYATQLKPGQRALLQAFGIYREAIPLAAALAVIPAQRGNANHDLTVDLAVLLDLGLLQAFEEGKYRLHPVIANFTRQKTNPRTKRTAHLKAARYYHPQERGVFADAEGSNQMAHRRDFSGVVEAVWHLCQANRRDDAYRLMQETELFPHLHRQGQNSVLLALYLELLAEQSWSPVPVQAARLQNELGDIRNALGQKNAALRTYQHALSLFRQTDDLEGTVEALNNVGAMHRVLRAPQQAQECYQEALRVCAETAQRLVQQGTTFNNLGRLAYERGDRARQSGKRTQAQTHYREALAYYEQALTSYQADKRRAEEALALNHLGDAHQALGERELARSYYWQALRRFQELEDRRGEGLSLNNLGHLYQRMAGSTTVPDHSEEARLCYEQALRLFHETGDRWQESIVLSNLGRFYPVYSRWPEEKQRYERSLACLIVANQLAAERHERQSTPIPGWIEETIRRWLASSGAQSYKAFLQTIQARAEEIVADILRPN